MQTKEGQTNRHTNSLSSFVTKKTERKKTRTTHLQGVRVLNPFLVPQLSCGRQRSTGRRRNGFAKSIATNRRQRPAPPSRTGCLRSRRTNWRRLQSVGKYRRCCERLLFYNRQNAFVFKIHVYFNILKKSIPTFIRIFVYPIESFIRVIWSV